MSQSCVPIQQSTGQVLNLQYLNQKFEHISAVKRIEIIAKQAPDHLAMTSSFGIHSAVTLHLINQVVPNIPIIMIDTGYLFKETYQYAEQLVESLNLNLQVFQSRVSPARFESLYGPLWEQGLKGIQQYNQWRKVEPLEHALQSLSVDTWFSGIRRDQSDLRKNMDWITIKNQRHKVHPLLDCTDRDVFMYLKDNNLPQHPLWEQGYLSVGDTHTTRSIHEVNNTKELRFFGLKRECGIHE